MQFCKSSGKHSSIIVHNSLSNFDPTCLFDKCAKEINIISETSNRFDIEFDSSTEDPCDGSIVSCSSIQHGCPFLTHLLLIGQYTNIGVNTIEVLSKAVEGGKFPVLSHLRVHTYQRISTFCSNPRCLLSLTST